MSEGQVPKWYKWATYVLGALCLLFLVLTITFGIKMNDKEKEYVREEVEVPGEHPGRGDGVTSLQHPFYDPLDTGAAARKLRAFSLRPEVEEIFEGMTFEDKLGQLNLFAYGDASGPSLPEGDERLWFTMAAEGKIGSLINVVSPPLNDALQELSIGKAKVPILMGLDIIHGYRSVSSTPLGLSASWDPEMVENLARVAGREARSEGLRWTFGPMVDIGRDPRWGRVMEGWGEDAYLHGLFGAAVVRGFQAEGIATCVKHIAGYGLANAGLDYTGNDVSWVKLHNDFFEGYERTIAAGALTTMASFNTLMGVPSHANREIHTDVVRGLWDFQGFTVADYGGVKELGAHGWVPWDSDHRIEAAKASFFAGVDMNMADGSYIDFDQIAADTIVSHNHTFEEYVDMAARRVLYVKQEIGLFDEDDRGIVGAYDQQDLYAEGILMGPEQIAAVREATEKSAVLLKNNDATLPFDPHAEGVKILVVGKIADDHEAHLGSWYAAGMGDTAVVRITTFLSATDELCGTSYAVSYDKRRTGNWCYGDPLIDKDTDDEDTDGEDVGRAVRNLSAKKSTRAEGVCDLDYLVGYACQLNSDPTKDEPRGVEVEEAIANNDYTHIIVMVGENAEQNGEGASRAHLEFAQYQAQLTQRVVEAANKKENKPKLILVPIISRPNILSYEEENYDAILLPWAPGTDGGHAIWNLLTGKAVPGGKITMTFPRAMGQIPIWYSSPQGGRPVDMDLYEYPPYKGAEAPDARFKTRYIDEKLTPLYPFGFGLSYDTFAYEAVSVEPTRLSADDGDQTINIKLTVRRSGDLTRTAKAAEIVQVYVKQHYGIPVPELKRIRGHARVEFDQGESVKEITIPLTLEKDFARYDLQLNKRVERGDYTIFVAKSSDDESNPLPFTIV